MDKAERGLLLWWLVLVALTLLSFESAWGAAWLANPRAGIAVIIGVALFKVRIVLMHFMDVGDAPWVLRAPVEVWIGALAAAMLGLWYAAGA